MVVSGRSQTGLLVVASATAWRAMLLLSITADTATVLLTLPVVNSSIEQACRTSRKNLAGAFFCQQREMEREEEESVLRLAFEVPWGETTGTDAAVCSSASFTFTYSQSCRAGSPLPLKAALGLLAGVRVTCM